MNALPQMNSTGGAHASLPIKKWPDALLGRPLAFDVGFLNGRDTLEYLRNGHRVVAVEANPTLCEAGRRLFAGYIRSGQLRIIQAVLSDEDAPTGGTRPFYVHQVYPEWSSLVRSIGCRKSRQEMYRVDTTQCNRTDLPMISCRALILQHGSPYMLKLDIEGHEGACLRPLPQLAASRKLALPQFISLEYAPSKLRLLPWLMALGYGRMKFVDQRPFMDWSGPYGEAARDVAHGIRWTKLTASWLPSQPCPSWCDLLFSLGPPAKEPSDLAKILSDEAIREEAKLLDKARRKASTMSPTTEMPDLLTQDRAQPARVRRPED